MKDQIMYTPTVVSLLLVAVLAAPGAGASEASSLPPISEASSLPPDSDSVSKDRPLWTLKQAQETALRNNPDFKNLDEQIYQADMAIRRAWSLLLPNLTAEASVTRNNEDAVISLPTGDGQPPMEITVQDLWEETASFNINLTLFDPESIPIIKLAHDEAERRRLQSQIDRNELLFAVTSAYYQAHAMKELKKAADENLETARAFLQQARTREFAGDGTMIDVNRGELQVLTAEEELADAEDAETRALIALKHLIQTDADFDIAGPEAVGSVSETLEALTSRAMEKRLELKETAVEKRMADRSRKQTLTKFLPKLDITYAWSWSSTEGFAGTNVNWTLVFGAKWALFQGGDRLAEYRTRQSEMRVADNRREKLVSTLKEEVETRYLDVLKRQRKVEATDRKVVLNEENHRLITTRFEAGVISSLEVVNAATKLSNQRLLSVYQRLLFDLAVLGLRKAAGEYNALAAQETSLD